MSLQSRYRFASAWLPDGWHRNVVISIDPAGDIVDVAADDAVSTARPVNGAAIPGMPNVHSHAFQRAMVGLAERRSSGSDTFWTWREAMYGIAQRITPEVLNALAAQLYAEMLKAGYTAVCEFHYLHNQPDGAPYDDPDVMSHALIDAAAAAGIGLTLLPALYQGSDFGGAAPTERQRQFVLEIGQFVDLVQRLRASSNRSGQLQVGVALHSLRAVTPTALQEVLSAVREAAVIHIHIAEQEREVEAALAHLGRRPVEWLLGNAAVDERWSLVHATHATPAELDAIAASRAVVALCPTTEANLGDGAFGLERYLAAGGAFAIGSDSHIGISPCEELRWLEYQARLRRRERNVCAVQADGSTGSYLWRSASAAGAQASGRKIGALEAGRRADIVVLDTSASLLVGRAGDDIADTFVFCGPSDLVRDVMVGGRWLVQDGRHFAETAIAAGYRRAMERLKTL